LLHLLCASACRYGLLMKVARTPGCNNRQK
jgi:hypothetical protein